MTSVCGRQVTQSDNETNERETIIEMYVNVCKQKRKKRDEKHLYLSYCFDECEIN